MKLKKYFLFLTTGLGVIFGHWLVLGRPGAKIFYIFEKPAFFRLFEGAQILFLSCVFLAAVFLILKKKLIKVGFLGKLFSVVVLATGVLSLVKFSAPWLELLVCLFFSFSLVLAAGLAGRVYEAQNSLKFEKFSFKEVFVFSVFWVFFISFFYGVLRFLGRVTFLSAPAACRLTLGALIFGVLVVSFWASLSEEVIYRLYLLNFLENLGFHPGWSLIFSSFFWALAHVGGEVAPFYLRIVEIFLIGLGLGLLYFKFGFWFVFKVHFLADLILLGLPVFYSRPLLIGSIFAGILFIGLLWRQRFKKVEVILAGVILFFVFTGRGWPLALVEFCRISQPKDLGLKTTQKEYRLAQLNQKLLGSEYLPKLSLGWRAEKNKSPNFLVDSLKKDITLSPDLLEPRYQIEAGAALSWLLFDSKLKLKEKVARLNLAFQETFLKTAGERRYFENFRLFLSLAKARAFLKIFLPYGDLIKKIKIIFQKRWQAGLITEEKFGEFCEQAEEALGKINFLKEKENELSWFLKKTAGRDDEIETKKEENLFLNPESFFNESFCREDAAGAEGEVLKTEAALKRLLASPQLFWQLTGAGRYFFLADSSSFKGVTHNFEPGWQVGLNLSVDLFNPASCLEKEILSEQENLNFLRFKEKINERDSRHQELKTILVQEKSLLPVLRDKARVFQKQLLKDSRYFQAGLVAAAEFWPGFFTALTFAENYFNRSEEFFLKYAEYLEYSLNLKKWLEVNYENL